MSKMDTSYEYGFVRALLHAYEPYPVETDHLEGTVVRVTQPIPPVPSSGCMRPAAGST